MKNIKSEPIVIPGSNGRSIIGDITYQKGISNRPIIIFCHGYKGFKDWGAWTLVAEKFAEEAYIFLKFNFSHNGGTIEDPIDFPDLDAFGKNNFSIELSDIGDVLDYMYMKNPYRDMYNLDQLCLIGHSRGGGISIIKSSIDNRIKQLVSWAAIADIEGRFPKGERMDRWRHNGVRYVVNGRTNQEMPHYYSFYEDFLKHKSLLHIETASKLLKIPQLIINGMADTAVKPEEAQLLKKWNPTAKLHLIDRCGHTFGTKHPWERKELPIFMKEVVGLTIDFLKDSLGDPQIKNSSQ